MPKDSAPSYNVKWMRHYSRVTPFLLYNDAKDSLLVCIANILLLRRKIQLSSGTTSISFHQLCSLIIPLVKRVDSQWIVDTVKKMEHGCKPKCRLNSLTVSLDADIAKLMTLLCIRVFHGCIAGSRYKNVESFTFEKLRYHLMLYQRGQQMEGVRFDEPEATAADAFIKKYPSKLTEKGLQLIRAEFNAKAVSFNAVFHQNRFLTVTCNDDTLFTLMADAIYEPRGCIWEQLDKALYMDERFKPYYLDPNEVKLLTPLATPRCSMESPRAVPKRSTLPKVPLVSVVRPSIVTAPTRKNIDFVDCDKSTEVNSVGNSEDANKHITEGTAAKTTVTPYKEAPLLPPTFHDPILSSMDTPVTIPRRTNEFSQAGSTKLLRNGTGSRCGRWGCWRFKLRNLFRGLLCRPTRYV